MPAVKRGRIEDNMIMAMLSINMSSDDERMIAPCETQRKLAPNLVRLVRRDFARLERLANMIRDNVRFTLTPAGLNSILPLGESELRVRSSLSRAFSYNYKNLQIGD